MRKEMEIKTAGGQFGGAFGANGVKQSRVVLKKL